MIYVVFKTLDINLDGQKTRSYEKSWTGTKLTRHFDEELKFEYWTLCMDGEEVVIPGKIVSVNSLH